MPGVERVRLGREKVQGEGKNKGRIVRKGKEIGRRKSRKWSLG